jgi:hypothetical protein
MWQGWLRNPCHAGTGLSEGIDEITSEDTVGRFVANPTELGEIRPPSLKPEDPNLIDDFYRDAAFLIVGC